MVEGNNEVGNAQWTDFADKGVEGVVCVAHEDERTC